MSTRLSTSASASLALAALLVIAPAASAAGVTAAVGAATSAAVSVTGTGSSGAASSTGASVGVSDGAVTSADASSTDGAAMDASAQGGASAGISGTLSLSRSGLSTGPAAGGMSAAAVISNDDLDAYARTAMTADANIQAMRATADGVALSYKERAYFLGFIPASLTTTAQADANGDVSVKYPWYGFLFRKSHTDLQTSLKANVQASMNSVMEAGTGTTTSGAMAMGSLDAGEQAAFLDAMHRAMQSQYTADFGANAAAQGSASGNAY